MDGTAALLSFLGFGASSFVLGFVVGSNTSPTPGLPPEVGGIPLLSAIIAVESGGNPNAVGDDGAAVGVLQIHPIMVADCNRLAPAEHFTLADRLDPARSVRMFEVYTGHYFPNGTDEQIARGWNGGPHGPDRPATLGYWKRVEAAMKGDSR